jgi:hypothetical protein
MHLEYADIKKPLSESITLISPQSKKKKEVKKSVENKIIE